MPLRTYNMKKLLLSLFIIAGFASLSTAQITIFEDFDSYEVGDDIVEVNPTYFEYWPNTSVGLPISDEQAFSGSNSIYLFSAEAGGGPDDVVMNFQDVYDSGTASLSFQMYVSPDHAAYYNVQGVDPPASAGTSSWASQVYFESNGTVTFEGANGVVIASAIYPQGQWFEVRYDVNLDENIWELSLDGRCLASYANERNSFASFNLYPFGSGDVAEYWFDDMLFTHSPDAQEVANDAGLILGNDPLGGLEGATITNVAGLLNNVGDVITSATLEVDYDGETTTIEMDGLNLMEGDTAQVNTDTPLALTSGLKEILVRLTSVNGIEGDDVICNNSLFAVTTAVEPAPNKAVLVEEATGTWCTWCPRGAVFMERMAEKYGDLFVGIAVHNADPMVVTEYDSGLTSNASFSGFPSVSVERTVFIDPAAVESPFLESVAVAPRGAFEIGADLDENTGEMKISLELEALQSLFFADNVALVIVEDEVTGSGPGWEQINAYAGGGQGPMGGYENLPNPVPADQMVYEDVARALVTAYDGQDADIEGILSAGESKLYNFTFTLDPSWDTDHLSLVAILLNSDGSANNAKEVSLADAQENGFVQSSVNDPALQASFEVYPNPAADLLNIRLESPETGDVQLELINTFGQTVKVERLQSFAGTQNWIINISDLPNGHYMTRVKIGNKTAVKTMQKFTK